MKIRTYLFIFFILLGLSGHTVLAQENPNQERLLKILEEGNQFYGTVENYRARFEKQEASSGQLQEKETIFLKFEKPFKIFMKWMNTSKKGLQVVYERGKHGGKLAIHKPGLGLGLIPVVFLDQNSPWVREGSQAYDIEDAGIGTFLEDFTQAVHRAREAGQLKVEFLDSETVLIEKADVIFDGTDEKSGYFAYRVVVDFDLATALPIRMSLYDWQNQPTGIYAYEDLKINLRSEDGEFKNEIQRQLYRVYQGR